MLRRVKRKFNFCKFLITVICLVSLGLFFLINNILSIEKNDNNFDIINNNDNKFEDVEESIQYYSASLVMVGDNLIHSSVYKDAYKNGIYDFRGMYDLVKPIVSEYDLAYYNQETILGGSELGVSDYPRFNSPYEVGDAMIDAGFNMVSLASNHTIDKGERAVINSFNYWNSKSDVLAVGSYNSFDSRNSIDIREVNNISYTMLNYTYGTNGLPVPGGKEYLVNVWPVNGNDPSNDSKYQSYKNQVRKDIEAVRDSVDVLMVAMHWGVEYTHEPTVYEKDMASYLASLGVDIIIGTHPHVIQPIEWIDDTLVIYSLGNFISAQYQNKSTCINYKCVVGLMSSLEIHKIVKGEDVIIDINNVDNDLVYTYYKNWRNFKVVPFSNSEIGKYLPNYRFVYDTYKNIVQKYDSSISVKPLGGY